MVKVQHVGISVSDLDRSVAWYVSHFGFEETKRFEKPELEIKGAALALGDCGLEILAPYAPVSATKTDDTLVHALRATGANHMALAVDDVAACYRKFVAEGVEMISELLDGRFFFCRDPDGTVLEIK